MVFLHSALTDHRQWGVQVDTLSYNYRCITYDLLGYGSSESAPENYDPAESLLALLDHLEVAAATLVGSSLGGSVAIHAGVRYPDRIQSMVLTGTGLFGFQPKVDSPDDDQLLMGHLPRLPGSMADPAKIGIVGFEKPARLKPRVALLHSLLNFMG